MAIFKQKIPNWVNFGGSCNGRCWHTYVMAIWSILLPFCIFCGNLVNFMFFGIISRFGKLLKEKIWQPCGQCTNPPGASMPFSRL
jgi:hypothetical protein